MLLGRRLEPGTMPSKNKEVLRATFMDYFWDGNQVILAIRSIG